MSVQHFSSYRDCAFEQGAMAYASQHGQTAKCLIPRDARYR